MRAPSTLSGSCAPLVLGCVTHTPHACCVQIVTLLNDLEEEIASRMFINSHGEPQPSGVLRQPLPTPRTPSVSTRVPTEPALASPPLSHSASAPLSHVASRPGARGPAHHSGPLSSSTADAAPANSRTPSALFYSSETHSPFFAGGIPGAFAERTGLPVRRLSSQSIVRPHRAAVRAVLSMPCHTIPEDERAEFAPPPPPQLSSHVASATLGSPTPRSSGGWHSALSPASSPSSRPWAGASPMRGFTSSVELVSSSDEASNMLPMPACLVEHCGRQPPPSTDSHALSAASPSGTAVSGLHSGTLSRLSPPGETPDAETAGGSALSMRFSRKYGAVIPGAGIGRFGGSTGSGGSSGSGGSGGSVESGGSAERGNDGSLAAGSITIGGDGAGGEGEGPGFIVGVGHELTLGEVPSSLGSISRSGMSGLSSRGPHSSSSLPLLSVHAENVPLLSPQQSSTQGLSRSGTTYSPFFPVIGRGRRGGSSEEVMSALIVEGPPDPLTAHSAAPRGAGTSTAEEADPIPWRGPQIPTTQMNPLYDQVPEPGTAASGSTGKRPLSPFDVANPLSGPESEDGESEPVSSLGSRTIDTGPRHAWSWAGLPTAGVSRRSPLPSSDLGASGANPEAAVSAGRMPPGERISDSLSPKALTSGFYTAGSDEIADPAQSFFTTQ